MTVSPEPAGLLPVHAESWEDVARYWYEAWMTLNELATQDVLRNAEIRQVLTEESRRVERALRDLLARLTLEPDLDLAPEIHALLRPQHYEIDQEPPHAPS